MGEKANKIPRIDLLERDVSIMFYEIRRLREENELLRNQLLSKEREEVNEEKLELAYFIKSQREARGLTKKELSRRIGVNAQTLVNYEYGKGRIEGMEKVAKKIQQLGRVNK